VAGVQALKRPLVSPYMANGRLLSVRRLTPLRRKLTLRTVVDAMTLTLMEVDGMYIMFTS
jgi:hypothetical protein